MEGNGKRSSNWSCQQKVLQRRQRRHLTHAAHATGLCIVSSQAAGNLRLVCFLLEPPGAIFTAQCKSIIWLNLAYVVPKCHPFRCKYDIDWKKVDRIKISNYSKQQAFGWRSTHGKLYGNKDFFRFRVKQSGKCGYCDNPRQSVEHLYCHSR
jgi:hypothetical protein